ncbi:PREDICTED: tetratricopeptide repeat protein 28-like [Acropora digitifera]|uniref:tetratricopeptide repeat protein 28-like n=1 Tax=Acropora digitifera TaxID=70779 RepID=UPI00077AB118|nr:PREDICTED: tetratricopeptide repeat protein 28-like [Acropora digitifera]
MADGDDVIRKACDNFSLHLKYLLTLTPEQRQAVEALLQGKDVLAILQTGYGKSMIFQVYVAEAALKKKEHQTVLVVCPLGCIISPHPPTPHERASSQSMFLWVTSTSFLFGHRFGELTAYGNIGNAYTLLGDYQKAFEHCEKCLKIAQEIDDWSGEGRAYGNLDLGFSYQSLGHYRKAIQNEEKLLKIAQEIGFRSGEGAAYGNLGNAYQLLGDFQKAFEYYKKHLKIAQEIGDRCGEAKAYGHLGNVYYSLGAYRKANKYHKKRLKIAQEIGDQEGEGNAYCNSGAAYFCLQQFENAADKFGCAVKAFNAMRSCLKAKDNCKISFRELHEAAYTGLWMSLLRIKKLDEALFAAERGRAQTLSDSLFIQYKLPASLSAAAIDPKEIISRLFTEVSLPTLFLAIEELTINIWFLSRGKKVTFRQGRLEGDRTENDPVRALLQSCLKKIQTEGSVRCEDRTLDELTRDCPSGREVREEVKKPFRSIADNHFKV